MILDAGGVILHPDLDWLAEQATDLGHPVQRRTLFEAYYRTIHDLDLNRSMPRRGPAFTDLQVRVWFFSTMLKHAGVPGPAAAEAGPAVARRAMERFPRESDIYHWAMPDVPAQLERLRDVGFMLGSASNNDDALEDQLRSVGVLHLFSALKDSGREGVAKPDPELLLRAARDLSVPPTLCLYVGDVDRVDGQAARAAGMAFALLDPLHQPRPARPLCIPSLDAIHRHFVPADPDT